MRIFDGHRRRRAIQDTLDRLGNDKGQADKLAELQASSVPIVLYAEDDVRLLRQMFTDASKTKRIEANVVARFDKRDPFNLAAMHLADKSKLFGGRVEMNATTVARGSLSLISINQVAHSLKAVKTLAGDHPAVEEFLSGDIGLRALIRQGEERLQEQVASNDKVVTIIEACRTLASLLTEVDANSLSEAECRALERTHRVLGACPMKLGRNVSRHNELDNWRNTHRYESVMATIWLFLTISETDPGLWDRLLESVISS